MKQCSIGLILLVARVKEPPVLRPQASDLEQWSPALFPVFSPLLVYFVIFIRQQILLLISCLTPLVLNFPSIHLSIQFVWVKAPPQQVGS